jgi:hypothetical protein
MCLRSEPVKNANKVPAHVHSSLGVCGKVSIISKMIWELTDKSSPKRIPEIMIDVSKVGAIHWLQSTRARLAPRKNFAIGTMSGWLHSNLHLFLKYLNYTRVETASKKLSLHII